MTKWLYSYMTKWLCIVTWLHDSEMLTSFFLTLTLTFCLKNDFFVTIWSYQTLVLMLTNKYANIS